MKVGDPPAFPTPIDPCPKCKKKDGWDWKYSKFGAEVQTGYSKCEGCGAEFH